MPKSAPTASQVIRLAARPENKVAAPPARSSIAKTATANDKPEKAYEVRAEKPMGLLLRVQPSGLRTYYVQLARAHRVRIGPAGTFTLEQAKERARTIILDPDAATTRTHSSTLAEHLAGPYAAHAQARLKNGARSVARVGAVWQTLLSKRMADISDTDVDRIRTKRLNAGAAPATVNRDVAALSGVFTHWAASTKGAVHPLANMGSLKVADDETIRYLAPEESKRLREALATRDERYAVGRANANEWRAARDYPLLPTISGNVDHVTPMVLLSLNTGVRQGELFSLAWERVDVKHKTLSVLASHSKGNSTRTIPLNVEALAVLVAIRPEVASGLVFVSPVTGGRFNNVKKAWTELTTAAKLPTLRWHDLRHDFASQLVMKGVPLFTVQKLLGHTNAKMTQRYARLAPSTLADAVNLL